MKSIKQLFIILSLSLVFTGCMKSEKPTDLSSSETEIKQKLADLYATYGKSSDLLYSQAIAKDLFSPALEKTLQQAVDASIADIEKIAKSDHPTDKPALLEGSIFTSLYEGFTSYKITSIDISPDTSASNLQADVLVTLENTRVSPSIHWTDSVHLRSISNNGWRIENIKFSEKEGNNQDLQTSLQRFITATQAVKTEK
ncbi:MAG: hypothetical protein RR749_09035 [Comamonas sp.]